MTLIESERNTQKRVIRLFQDQLDYQYLGDWSEREGNSNLESEWIRKALLGFGYSNDQINRALDVLSAAANNPNRDLYENNKAVYNLLRYGIPLKMEAGKATETLWLVDWTHLDKNQFAIAEEVTLKGNHERRPDLVLYLNGIAIAVIELKKSTVSIADGISQCISNQSKEFNEWFFSTVQLVFAGSDSQGLQYGTIGTQAKFFLTWKEDEQDNSQSKLDKYLLKMCGKARMLELIHDFVLFDGGIKKLPRVHQYFGIKKAQEYVQAYKGGIIWHTQGSGKSIVMVLLAKWILENNPKARVAIVTDRDELDKQIERVFIEAGENKIKRASSGSGLMDILSKEPQTRLICSLVHKFGSRGVDNFEAFISELKNKPSMALGELFVFVDECHRTQSGKLHRTMKALLPNAVFIGFTGTPLLKEDKSTSQEVFGGYIHTYKFGEAVEDKVVLDLIYEARNIEQKLSSTDRVDQWFDAKTQGLNTWQKAALREQWGTLQNVLSSRSRMDKVVTDILFDFSTKPRLKSERGNAMLVASSIFEACKYFELFQRTSLKGKCAVVTSYNPNTKDSSLEETGANTDTDRQYIYKTYTALLKDVQVRAGKTPTETYEDAAKDVFRTKPSTMRLLIVVDKLLTGFDAPSCTYLYIDKSMRDHGLFQAICRTNRLDGEDKTFGYIVDYKDLFTRVNDAISVYTSELDNGDDGKSSQILLKDRLKVGKERLDTALEAIRLLCEPVKQPRKVHQFIQYFCGNPEIASDLEESAPLREALYKTTATLLRAYGTIADELSGAGYTAKEISRIQQDLKDYTELRETIRNASGETLDLKFYEADMRYLIDSYIEASDPQKISPFDDLPLLDMIVKLGLASALEKLPKSIRTDKNAIAETIANNVRSRIIQAHLNDPAYYDSMSKVLEEVIADLKAKRIHYEEFLQRIAELAKNVCIGHAQNEPELLKNSPALRALYNNVEITDSLRETVLAEESASYKTSGDTKLDFISLIHQTVLDVRPDDFRGHIAKENEIKRALLPLLGNDIEMVEKVFAIIKQQPEY